ncbi:ABC transporter substrate-binding protein [Kribbella kalugense]|uniref:Peptide/nickel transport system substrate-binding protein n=1 Tax=Kribbella kalugense TaxID=2512221 RepID=A0A4R7ZZJ4_9ACTN|nr:ABC transporter substrate-binding protein [Kribbella kalugense]TDW21210.1 peptide/nickel transport system substrate-binding protein [Kribbella kalugense]
MKSSFRIRAVAFVATAAVLALTACSAGSSTSGSSGSSPGGDQKLSIGLVAEPASLDFTTTDGAAIPQLLLGNVYETLVKQDDSGKIVPSLAKSWTVSADRKTYTFDLVDTAKFTNGKPFTANDAVFSINRVKTAWTISLKAAMDVVSQAKALSPTQLQVTLAKPSNDWLFRMTTRIGAMFSESGVSALATDPVGTGPFKFSKWNRGDSIVMVRNDDYWGTKPFFQQITLKYFKDATALNNALLTSTINVIGTVQAPEALSQFTSNTKYQVIEGTTNGEVLLSFNNSRPVFKDIRTRQAIRMAIDHKALLDTCFAGRGKLIGSMVPPTDPWYEDLTGIAPYDLAKAKSLLQASGAAGKTLRLRLPTLPYATSCGQVVKSMLEQAGLKVQIDQLEFPAAWLTTVFKNADYDMSIIAHVEPRDLGAVFNAKYYTRYDDPTLQGYLAAADAGDEAAQVDNMKKAARRLSEQAAGDWLFLLPNLVVADKNIKGLPQNAITESFDLSKLAR